MELGEALETIREDVAMNIRIRAFEKCNRIFQLAYILTPAGQEDARHRHLHSLIPLTMATLRDDPDRDPSAYDAFAPHPNNLDSDGERVY
jgi:hypothetical protein